MQVDVDIDYGDIEYLFMLHRFKLQNAILFEQSMSLLSKQ